MADSKKVAQAVYDQLAEDFPPKAIGWVLEKGVEWEGPEDVPIKDIDYDNVHHWHAASNPAKVRKFEKKIDRGEKKPIILVRRPHKPTLMAVDGHHRALAYRNIGKPAYAYVATVRTTEGPWDSMHSSQNRYLQQQQKGIENAPRLDGPSLDGGLTLTDRTATMSHASVVVIDDGRGHVLVTSRNGNKRDLDLPGGMVEQAETAKDAAKRETREETGVTVTKLAPLFDVPWHQPAIGNRRYVHVFRATAHDANSLADFVPEAGQFVRWADPSELLGPECTFGPFTREHFDQLFAHLSAAQTSDVFRRARDTAAVAEDIAAAHPELPPPVVHALAEGACASGQPKLAVAEIRRLAREMDKAAALKLPVATAPTDATIPAPTGWASEVRQGLNAKPAKKITADLGAAGVHVDGLSGGYRLQTAEEKNPKVPDLAGVVPPPFGQPKPPPGTDITSPTHTPRWPLADSVPMISAGKRASLPGDKFALPELKKYPIDTAARVRNAAARLEQQKARMPADQYKRARAAIARAAKKFGIDSAYNNADAPAHAALVPHMRVEAIIPHGGNLHVRHLAENGSGLFVDAVSLSLSDLGEDGPVWNQVACVGAFRGHPAGPFELNSKVFDEIVRNWEATGRKPIPIDYEHASEADATSGSIPVTGAPAQGWITDLANRGDRGLFGKFEWLPQARAQVRAGQYKFLSPAIRFESRDKITGRPIGARLTSAALTNQPFLDNLAPVAAKATAKDLIAAKDAPEALEALAKDKPEQETAMPTPPNTAKPEAEKPTLMQSMFGDGPHHFVTPPSDYMPRLKAAMGLHPLATSEAMKDHLDRLRDNVAAAGGNLGALVDGVQLANFVAPLRECAMGSGGGASTTVEQILHAVEEMIDAAGARHEALEHPAGAAMAGYADAATTPMANIVESDKGSAAMAGYADSPAAMADKQGDEDMTAAVVAEKETEITKLQLQLSDKDSEIKKLKAENETLKAENGTLATFKTAREEQDLEDEVTWVMSAHADKISTLCGGDVAAQRAYLLKARKQLGEDFWVQYPKDADPAVAAHQYLLRAAAPAAPGVRDPVRDAQYAEVERVLSLGEDFRATTARLRDEKKLSYVEAAEQAQRLHHQARQLQAG